MTGLEWMALAGAAYFFAGATFLWRRVVVVADCGFDYGVGLCFSLPLYGVSAALLMAAL